MEAVGKASVSPPLQVEAIRAKIKSKYNRSQAP